MVIYIDNCHNRSLQPKRNGEAMARHVTFAGEFFGTAALVAVVVGSGLMVDSLEASPPIALLINQIATVLALAVLITLIIPLSGAHLNPVVTLAFALRRDIGFADLAGYVGAQLGGAALGVSTAQLMFDRPLLEISGHDRAASGVLLGEIVATSGLVIVVLASLSLGKARSLPLLVSAWIGSAYFFTSSTSFANPAVTLARVFTDSFTGISPTSAAWFISAQVLAVGIALALVRLFPVAHQPKDTP